MGTLHRLFLDQPLTAAGARLSLSADQAHYLLTVLRLQEGAELAVLNGQDGEWRAVLRPQSKRAAVLELLSQTRLPQPEPDLWLLFAPIKRTRQDWVIEKATELGVSALLPVWTDRTVASRVKDDRMVAIATEAAEQCERLSLPILHPPQDLATVLSHWDPARRLIVLDESGGGTPIATALATLPAGPLAVLVGPEGGFTKTELDGLRRLAFAVPVGLGPRILRADTAAVAALACVQAWCGDWGMSPRPSAVAVDL